MAVATARARVDNTLRVETTMPVVAIGVCMADSRRHDLPPSLDDQRALAESPHTPSIGRHHHGGGFWR